MINRKDIALRDLLRPRHSRMAWLVLLIALCVTAALWLLSLRLVEDRTESRFDTQSLQLKTAIEERLLNYEQVLAGSAGLFSVAGDVSRGEWRTYIDKVNIDRYYPGIQGIGYTRRVTVGDLHSHLHQLESEGLDGYVVRPRGLREEYHPIVYLEPDTDRNRRAFGYDAFQDGIHRRAMERARDTARPRVTGKVVLVQEEVAEDQAGFLMYYPVYHGGVVPQSLGERRMLLKGFVFSAFRANNLLDGIVGLIAPFLDVRIYDGSHPGRETLMYASNLGSLEEDFSFEKTQQIEYGGRTWVIQTRSTPAFDFLASDPRPAIVLGSGVLVSLLLFAFSLVLIRSRVLAQMSAGRYRAITEGASNITVVMDRRGRPTYVSPSCHTILGYDPDEARRQSHESRVHSDDWPQLRAGFQEALAKPGEQLPVIRARVRDASGEWREMEGSF
ncbi:MAG: CHASE domain-containing protein, partial [Marinobacter sp.]